MLKINPLLCTDGYKTSHNSMYPKNTNLVFSNFTPRSVKYMPEKAKDIIVFGTQYTIKFIDDLFQENFFKRDKTEVCNELQKHMNSYLGTNYNISHFEALYDLGFLPIEIRALDEGLVIEPKLPILTIYNTMGEFYWLPNFLETLISNTLWKPLHSASISYAFKKVAKEYQEKTALGWEGFLDFQCHDFSMRGLQSLESSIASALGFLVCSKGSDTLPVLQAAKYYYNEDNAAMSVPASEHAVMTAYGKEDEISSFSRILDLYPTGIVSMVSDQYNLWDVLTVFVPQLKKKILSREGKAVFRGDSGDPVDIICGNPNSTNSNEQKGMVELLWDVFGGTVNEQGYKILDSHVGTIYGDSITLERMESIFQRLQAKGFASVNVVLGVGSYTLGFCTRDSQGSAIKATYVEVDGIGRDIYKDPITDDGTKKSAKGLIAVVLENDSLVLKDQCKWADIYNTNNQLKLRYRDGQFYNLTTLEQIRGKL